MFHKQSETRGNQTALIDEMIGNQKVVKAFGYEEKSVRAILHRSMQILQKYSQKAVFLQQSDKPVYAFRK